MAATTAGESIYVIFGAGGSVGCSLVEKMTCQPSFGGGAACKVVLVDHSDKKLQDLKQCLAAKQQEKRVAFYASIDARNLRQVSDIFDRVKREYPNSCISGVASLVGDVKRGGLEETSPDDFLAIIGENLITAFNVLKCATHCVCPPATAAAAGAGAAAVKRMPAAMAPAGAPVEEEAPSQQRRPTAESSGCSIVLMSSATAGHGMWLGEAWSAAKAGVEGLARSAAATYAPRGLRINVVAPGFVEDKWAGEVPAEEISKVTPMGRLAKTSEVAAALAFLLCPSSSSFITGQTLHVDGGMSSLTCPLHQITSPSAAAGGGGGGVMKEGIRGVAEGIRGMTVGGGRTT